MHVRMNLGKYSPSILTAALYVGILTKIKVEYNYEI